MPQVRQAPRSDRNNVKSSTNAGTRTSSRSKRAQILEVATQYFGAHRYEDTKWAEVAAAVGIGSTALYHYFESKLHCLYVILADTLEWFQGEFDRITSEN